MKRVLFLLAVALVPLVAFAGGAAETKGGIPSLRFAHTWGEGDAKGPYFGLRVPSLPPRTPASSPS